MPFGKTAPDHNPSSFPPDPGCGFNPLTQEVGERDQDQAWGTCLHKSIQIHGELVLARGPVHTHKCTDPGQGLPGRGLSAIHPEVQRTPPGCSPAPLAPTLTGGASAVRLPHFLETSR